MPQPPESGPAPASPGLSCIVTAFAKEEHATEVVRTLVREQLVACGTLLRGARSIYVWQGNLEDAEEVVVIFKTTAAAADRALTRIRELHPYEVPEILVFAPESANPAYVKWVEDNIAI